MSERGTKSQIINGLFWKVMENGGSQGIQFVISILLARLLSTEEYGIINIVLIFVTIANVIVQNGFGTALIQKREADGRDYSSVFFVNLAAAGVIYLVLYLGAPFIAAFCENPQLPAIVQVLSLVLLMGVLFVTVPWRPSAVFAPERVGSMFRFGWKLLCASLVDTLFTNLYGLTVGKLYDENTMGVYSRGEQFPKLIVTNLGTAIQAVMLPALSARQTHPEQVAGLLRRAIKTSVFVVLPMMAGLAAAADNMVLVLLGEKWRACVPFLQISCLAYAGWPMDIANLQALNAMGRSDVFLKLEIIKKCVGVVILLLSMRCGAVTFIAWKAAGDFLCTFINAWPNQRILGYSIRQLWRDVFPALGVSAVMGAAVYLARFLLPAGLLGLAGQVGMGVAVYLFLSWIFRLESFRYLWRLVWEKLSGGAVG